MITCTNCKTVNEDTRKFCENCGTPLTKPAGGTSKPVDERPQLPPSSIPTPTDKQKVLRQRILGYAAVGYRLSVQTDQTAVVVRPKTISTGFAILWLVGFPILGVFQFQVGIGSLLNAIIIASIGEIFFLVQLAGYLGLRDEAIYLYFSPEGDEAEYVIPKS